MYTELKLLIDGKWIGTEARDGLAVHNPATGHVLGYLPVATAVDIAEAAQAASRSFAGWAERTALERGRILARIAAIIRERTAELAPILTLEQGKPLREAEAEIMSAADNFEWMAEEGKRLYGLLVPSRFAGAEQQVLYRPIGPVAAFSPWNFPAVLATRKIATALAAGCPIVLKPAEETPGILVAIARICVEAGVPDGVLNILFGKPAEISEALIRSPLIRKVTFTGSLPVGRHIATLCGAEMKPVTLELGGHSPVIVMDDIDVDAVVSMSIVAKFRNAGQICMCPTRFFVHHTVIRRFSTEFAERSQSLRVGDGMNETTQMGPLANARRLSAMQNLISDAHKKGARLLCGGKRHAAAASEGNYWEPTVITDVPDSAAILTEEPFGPIAVINPILSVEEALRRANATPYGLASFAFTGSVNTVRKIRDGIVAGTLSINSFSVSPPEMPFGGIKESGLGVEMGKEGILSYCDIKSFILADAPTTTIRQ